MLEITTFLNYNEITMLQDFMENRKSWDYLQNLDEVHSILETLGYLVTQPDFQDQINESFRDTIQAFEEYKRKYPKGYPTNDTDNSKPNSEKD